MAIGFVQKAMQTGTNTPITKAYTSNVTSGNFLTVEAARYAGATDPFVVGDLTKSAGTATIGTIALDTSTNNGVMDVGVWSVPVTGTGSLTWQLAGDASSFWFFNITEWSGNTIVKETSNAGTGTSTLASSGNMTSAGAALFIGIMQEGTSGAITQDGAFTLLNENENASFALGSSIYKIVTSGNTDACDWTISSQDWAAAGVVYKETATAPAPSVNEIVTLTEAVTMTMDLKNTAANDTATVTEGVTMHMPIHLRMEKLS